MRLVQTALAVSALAMMLICVGCEKKPKPVAQVPPPANVSGDAVYVGPPPADMSPTPAPAPAPVTYQPPSPVATPYAPPMSPAPAPAAAQPMTGARPSVYTVQHGDTLWNIAVRFYGDGQRYRDIARVNGIADENKLRVGQQLKLP